MLISNTQIIFICGINIVVREYAKMSSLILQIEVSDTKNAALRQNKNYHFYFLLHVTGC